MGCRLFEEHIPYDNQTKKMAEELNINPLVAALNGGEDYELLFTLPITDHSKIKNHPDITILGHITDKSKGINLITSGTASKYHWRRKVGIPLNIRLKISTKK